MSATLQEACYENTTAVYMALELSNKQWKVLIGDGHHHRHKTVVAGDIAGLLEQIALFRAKWCVPSEAPVFSCYEGSRAGAVALDILNRLAEKGPLKATWDPQGDTATRVPWADRMMRAHQNAVENLVIFAPLVLALQIAGISSAATVSACVVYFFARLVHYIVFTLRIPVVRVLAFAAGVAAQVTLALALLGLI